jgi:hypothetical protein
MSLQGVYNLTIPITSHWFFQLTSTEDVVISENTKVLSETTTQYLSEISDDGTTITFSHSAPELLTLEPGDIIVSDVTEVAPEGFLRSVSSISSLDDQVIVHTKNATLEEVVEEGSLSIGGELLPEDTRNINLAPGVSMVQHDQERAGDSQSWEFDLLTNLYEDEHGYFRIRGNLLIDLSYHFNLSIKRLRLQELSFTVTVEEESELFVEGEYHRRLAKEVPIAKVYFTPITFFIGPVPVVISPELELYVGVNGEVNAEFTTGITHEFSYTGGAKYERGDGWSKIRVGPHNNFTYDEPELSLDISIKAYAGIKASIKLYGFVGPYAKVEAFLEFEADINAVPWWELYAGYEFSVGIHLKVINAELDEEWLLLSPPKQLLAEAPPRNNPPIEPSNPSPRDGDTGVQPEPCRLSWVGGDPDYDEVTYDVYVYLAGEDDSSNDNLACESVSVTTCSIDSLSYDTDYVWHVIAQDTHGAVTEGPHWSFQTGRGEDSARFEGRVTDALRPFSVSNVKISFESSPSQENTIVYTDQHGYYSTYILPGTYEITASKPGYISQTVENFYIGDNQDETIDFILEPIMIKYSGYISSRYDFVGGHDYPLYAKVSSGPLPPPFSSYVFSDPFTGFFEIDLPATQDEFEMIVYPLINGHSQISFTFDHGFEDSLNNQIDIPVILFPEEKDCAPGYEWGVIGSDEWGCVPISGGVVAGFTYELFPGSLFDFVPLVGAVVKSDKPDVETESFGDPDFDPDNVGLYWLFQPTEKSGNVDFVAYYPEGNPQIFDKQSVEVVHSKIVQQDFYLSEATNRIQGTVVDSSNDQPLPNVEIEIWLDDFQIKTTIDTDQDGYYSVNVMPGIYTITASKYGYISQTRGLVGVKPDEDVVTVNFALDEHTVKFSGYVTSKYSLIGGHDYPLYAALRFTILLPPFSSNVFSDPFTGYFEIDLPATRDKFDVTVIPSIYGHSPISFEFEHGGKDSLNNQIDIPVILFPEEKDCAPGYEWGVIGSDEWGCVPISGGVVAGFAYELFPGSLFDFVPLVGAVVKSDKPDVETESFGDPDFDPDNVGLYWLFIPTLKTYQDVELYAYYPKDYPEIFDLSIVQVVQSGSVRQDFYLELPK